MIRSLRNIAWVPCNRELSNNRLFELPSARDNAIERFVEARKLLVNNGFSCNTIDLCESMQIDIVIFNDISYELAWLVRAIKKNPELILIYIPAESPIVVSLHDKEILRSLTFDRILVWSDELAKLGLPFVKANIGEPIIHAGSIPSIPFDDKNFLVAIYSNKMIRHKNGLYEERVRAFDFFAGTPRGFDIYGMGWEKSTRPSIMSSYKGRCNSKKEVLKKYKFAICFENATGYPGYISEKIFDCFAAGTVPIYYGAPNVASYIPKNCFIDFRDYKDYEHLYEYLVSIREHEYQGYLGAAKKFIITPQYYEFTSRRYAEVLLEQIQSLVKSPKTSHKTVLGLKWNLLRMVVIHPWYCVKNLKRLRRFLFDLCAAW